MIGRGLIGDPGMLTPGGTTAAALEAFFDELLEVYTRDFGGARNAMFRLKENWFYLLRRFEGSEKLGKAAAENHGCERLQIHHSRNIPHAPSGKRASGGLVIFLQ